MRAQYPVPVKHFLVYTGLRIALFVTTYAVLWAVATLLGAGESAWIWILIGAAVISSVLSLRFLSGPRERLAQSVQERAERASAKFEEMKSKEDAED